MSASSESPVARGTRYVAWDGRTLGPWVGEVDGADAVINLSGESIAASRWTPARKRVLRASRIDPTRTLVAAIGHVVQQPLDLDSNLLAPFDRLSMDQRISRFIGLEELA